MTSIFNKAIFSLLGLAATFTILVSCEKEDKDKDSGMVELLSFGPTGAQHGDTIRFIGHNLDQVTAIHFTGVSSVVEKSDFKLHTPELILLIVPASAEQGFVTLKTAQGDIVSKTQFNLNVLSVVTSMDLSARPGTDITLSGAYLNWVKRIVFPNDKLVTSFVSQSFEQIVVTVPEDAQSGKLILFIGGTDSTDIELEQELEVVLPRATAMTPNPLKQLDNLTITGTDLDLTKEIYFTGVISPVTSFVSMSPTEIVVTVPDSARTGVVKLEAASGVQTEGPEELEIILPRATSISPNPIKHQENLTITGTDLDLAKKIYFTGVSTPVTSFVSQNSTQLVVTVPAGAKAGPLSLGTASDVQTQTTVNLQLTLPAISGITPNPADPGADITITGTNLDLVTSVTFSNTAPVTNFVSQSPTEIVVTVPVGSARGVLTLGVLNSTVTVLSSEVLDITGNAPPPVVALPFYDDAVTSNWTNSGWIGGGWGGTADYNNNSPVRAGSQSVKIDYSGGYGSPMQLGGAIIPFTGYTHFKISIYGGAGSNGKSINIGINGSDSYTISVVEGEWTDYAIPIASLTTDSELTEIWVKEYSGTGGFTIYVDAMGLN